MQENITVEEWRKNLCTKHTRKLANYGGYVYDAMWTYAYALDKLLKNHPGAYNNFHQDNITRY